MAGRSRSTAIRRADPASCSNPDVEPICRKYLELRYRLMPYLYTAVRECHDTGLPIMRALWLHHPDDPAAVARGDEYLWGRDMLVAPVVERARPSAALSAARHVVRLLDRGALEGGREIDRPVDLATMPLYVRAGAVMPMGPVKQYTAEPTDAPLTLVVYPGADGASTLYEDDGKSFEYRQGAWMRIAMTWQERSRALTLRLAPGSRMLPPLHGRSTCASPARPRVQVDARTSPSRHLIMIVHRGITIA